jgi:hypothetical protein
MTFKQMVRNLIRNSDYFKNQGDVEKSQLCLKIATFIQERGYENISGRFKLSADNF